MIPDRVKIGPFTYQIERNATELLIRQRAAEIDYRRQTISVAGVVPDEQEEASLIHEMLHAAFYYAGLTAESGAEAEPVKVTEEEVIERITPYVYGFLKDNDFWPKPGN